jgi:hypothetical protein
VELATASPTFVHIYQLISEGPFLQSLAQSKTNNKEN